MGNALALGDARGCVVEGGLTRCPKIERNLLGDATTRDKDLRQMKSTFCQLGSIRRPLEGDVGNVSPRSDPFLKSLVKLMSTQSEEPMKCLRYSWRDV
jgi:hypothetical protein